MTKEKARNVVKIMDKEIKFSFQALQFSDNDTGAIYFRIPAFNIYFLAKDKKEYKKALGYAFEGFLNNYFNNSVERAIDIKRFILKLNSLGFKTEKHQSVMANVSKYRKLPRKNVAFDGPSHSLNGGVPVQSNFSYAV